MLNPGDEGEGETRKCVVINEKNIAEGIESEQSLQSSLSLGRYCKTDRRPNDNNDKQSNPFHSILRLSWVSWCTTPGLLLLNH
jgi:hypothetical protein